ncbi:thiamine biosynthesis protein ApbE [Erwinia sp. OLTSP20]|uniref:FAD:protein FMN transferase n=1 Tax=unclassified Erwinia TaxID=2622719 RepID=UPI000C1A5657|nr:MULTISPECIES: FAD:protein FMN transferase [unclassified Erwinia]PIJ48470.1 thiamine biosynthesis protein ApbE [Erwinia sp. OAMSP11]PIJ75966.1 thiamine biosynthesis protein ApbE [Erwinia sp. OLSSP12]PIJ78866.1 thiamine biosynthesis protein ApbE [Erwinia sp. OLCASP19]PIJ87443.1 thiamine biosynthesis protein ApbE [Erwinia sp. OLMTSP26]PIJ88993.1 thiamine biosynthesis protein ApbE [Erwinia sp. OLMDSP33]
MAETAGAYHYSTVLLGSPIALKLFQPDEALARRVFQLIKQLENLLTVNRSPSQIMAINQAAGRAAVSVSRPVYQLIKLAHQVSLTPGGCFNFAIGPLVKCWKIGFQGNSVPAAHEIARLLRLTDPRDIELDDAAQSVFLRQPGMEIDLGAIAKGWIADRVQEYLRQQGVAEALINLGGNVQTLGVPATTGHAHWCVGLQTPFAGRDALLGTIGVREMSVVTSGVYERFFTFDGRDYHHILDPLTGYPLDNELLSVTVISRHSVDGDIFTTLLYGLGSTQGCQLLQAYPDIDAIFVTRDQRIICSSQRLFNFVLTDPRYRLEFF